jgi:hypothetical protein
MSLRSCKLVAVAHSESGNASVSVSVNGNVVYSGATENPAITGPGVKIIEYGELCTFDIDSSLTGNIALSITATSGNIYFKDIIANYSAFAIRVQATGDQSVLHPEWPEWIEVEADAEATLTSDQVIFGNMNLPVETVTAGDTYKLIWGNFPTPVTEETSLSELLSAHYSNPSLDYLDNGGISSVHIDGEEVDPFEKRANGLVYGISHFRYVIPENSTLTFNYYINPIAVFDPDGTDNDLRVQINALTPRTYPYNLEVNEWD